MPPAKLRTGRLVYGPVPSRRLGHSLGVNLGNPAGKSCSRSCVYCQCGAANRFPAPELHRAAAHQIVALVQAALTESPWTETVTLSGNTEPTESPAFAEVVAGLNSLRQRLGAKWRLVCFTNGSGLGRSEVVAACRDIDEVWAKLDSATEVRFRAVSALRPSYGLDEHLSHLMRLDALRVQTLLWKGPADRPDLGNFEEQELAALVELTARVAPRSVVVHSLERTTATVGLRPVPFEELERYVARLRARGLHARAVDARNRPHAK